MPFPAKIIVLRREDVSQGQYVGDVVDILPDTTFEGIEVVKVGQTYSRVYTEDLDEGLAEELKSGVKRLKAPEVESQFYQELTTQGYTEATNEQLLTYVEVC